MNVGKIMIACARFNPEITQKLLEGARLALKEKGIHDEQLLIAHCPGAFELPVLLKKALMRSDVIGGIALGCVIQGGTRHFDYVAGECSRGVMQVMLDTGKPIGFGVLTTFDESQAFARAGEKENNKGYESACVALEMLDVLNQVNS